MKFLMKRKKKLSMKIGSIVLESAEEKLIFRSNTPIVIQERDCLSVGETEWDG